jgi:hypothetical protein
MIITPPINTPIHDIETDYQSSINEETLHKMIVNNNWLLDLRPIGTIVFINTNQPGSSTPDSSVYQICDGSEIVHPLSPIRSIGLHQRFTPDLRGKYPRGANDWTTNPIGGTWDHNVEHAHSTGGYSSLGSTITADKGDRSRRDQHTHSIGNSLSNPVTIETPAYIVYNAYMKIS